MTIVKEEMMNPNQNLEAELEEDPELNDAYDDADYEVEDGDSPSDEGRPLAEVAEWVTLSNHPAPTTTKIRQCLRRITNGGRNSLTLLILGRAGVGKSSTVNSIFATTVTQAIPFHMITYSTHQPVVVRKKADGVTVTVIDTPGLVESDAVSETVPTLTVNIFKRLLVEQGLKRMAFQSRQHPVDVVLFVDRVDMHQPDELDLQMMNGLTRTFGPGIWSRMVIGLTRADIKDPVPGQTFDSMIEKRVNGIREAMRRAGARDAELPYVLIENNDRCRRNAAGEKVLNERIAWIPTFFETVVEVAQSFSSAYKYNPKSVNKQQQFITRFCIIPLVLLTQILVKVFILDRIIHEDGLRGDRYGPFDATQREYEKAKDLERRGMKKVPAKRSSYKKTLEEELSEDSDED